MKKGNWMLLTIAMLLLNNYSISHSQESTKAKVFAPELFSDADFFALTFAPDGKTLYVTRGTAFGGGLFESKLSNGSWSKPKKLSFTDSSYVDNDLFVSPDGSKYFYMTKRPIRGNKLQKEQDIWVVEKSGDNWSEPKHLGPILNSSARDGFPSVTADGTLYFFSTRNGGSGSADIYRSTFVHGIYTTPENLGPNINSGSWDGLPYVTPDEKVLVFFSSKPGGYGGGDLYVSYNRNGSWTEPENLGASVNTEEADITPHISPDKKYLFFARRNKDSNKRVIYYIDIKNTIIKFENN